MGIFANLLTMIKKDAPVTGADFERVERDAFLGRLRVLERQTGIPHAAVTETKKLRGQFEPKIPLAQLQQELLEAEDHMPSARLAQLEGRRR